MVFESWGGGIGMVILHGNVKTSDLSFYFVFFRSLGVI